MKFTQLFLLLSLVLFNLAVQAAPSSVLRYNDTQDSLFDANFNQTKIYRELDCAQKYVDMVLERFEGSTVEVITYGKLVKLDKSSLTFCGVKDLVQGSYNITRQVSLCVEYVTPDSQSWSGALYMTTQGDMFCDGEKLISVDGLWVH